jgi:stage V sporulation protein D (sporulation-specific penicillin-binding protein)
MSFGQGIAVTPIQLLSASAVIGNDGQLMQPRLVKALTDSDGNVVQEFEPKVLRQVISANTANEMKLIMEYSVSQLGGGNAAVPGFRVGGKTGTAQRARDGVYIRGEVVGSFIGMAPMDDPQIAVLMVVENPRSAQFGSLTAAPGVRLILQDVLRYLNVQPRFTQEELDRMQRNLTTVPNVTGRSFSEAAGMLGGASLQYTVSPATDSGEDFIIVGQFPPAGQRINTDGIVFLYRE